jgi:putative RecB family exonuclease
MATRKRAPVRKKDYTKNTITAWSFSRINTFEQCARKARYEYIDGFKSQTSAAMEHGSLVHDALERWVKYGDPRPKILDEYWDYWGEHVEFLREIEAGVECEWAWDERWKECSWFSGNVRCRVKLDVHYIEEEDGEDTLVVIDYKTGKLPKRYKGKASYDDQLDLYALGGFMKYPEIKKIRTELWYLKHNDDVVKNYTRKKFMPLLKVWEAKGKALMTETEWKPTVTQLCGWCDFRAKCKKEGGGYK